MKGPKDPVDHSRTTRPHAGETWKDNVNLPAIVLVLISIVLFVSSLAAFATRHHDVGLMLVGISVGGFAVSMIWLYLEHRRVRRIEERWYSEHPDAVRQRPSS
jgi:hypothetical protein